MNYDPANCINPASPRLGAAETCPLANQFFTQDIQQYYGTARLDATLTQKIRVFGSWLNQFDVRLATPAGDRLKSGTAGPNSITGTGLL